MTEKNNKPTPDSELQTIANYIIDYQIDSPLAMHTAYLCLLDAISCALMALQSAQCRRLLGPIVPHTIVPHGARVLGCPFILDPVTAAFNIGTLIRWLDFNDTWLAAEWGHPSDNLGAILAVSDFVSQQRLLHQQPPLCMRDIFIAMIKAYEIQGILALENSLNRVGLDHVAFVKAASAACAMQLLGGDKNKIIDVLSAVWVDGQALRTYRHAPNTGSRKSWAAGDATARAVFLALLTQKGETGCPTAFTAKKWGFYDVSFHGKSFHFPQALTSYVMENILFKVAYPAEFHAQTAVECAILLHPTIMQKLDKIEKIILTTQESAIRIISKTGPLHNYADRDHCLQYMVAVALLYGTLDAASYTDSFAADPRIDALRKKMHVEHDPAFSKAYLDPATRSIPNAIQVFFTDGTETEKITIHYPLGHQKRRAEAKPLLHHKFVSAVQHTFEPQHAEKIIHSLTDEETFSMLPVNELMTLLMTERFFQKESYAIT